MKRGILCILSVFLLMAELFHVGYQVEINGQALPGIYAPAVARQSAREVRRAAEEICRENTREPFRLRPVLCLRYTQTDGETLAQTMLEAYDGVSSLYAVCIGNARIGLTADPSLIGAIQEDYFTSNLTSYTDAVRLSEPIRIHPVLSYTGAETPQIELSRSLRETAEMVPVSSFGQPVRG